MVGTNPPPSAMPRYVSVSARARRLDVIYGVVLRGRGPSDLLTSRSPLIVEVAPALYQMKRLPRGRTRKA